MCSSMKEHLHVGEALNYVKILEVCECEFN